MIPLRLASVIVYVLLVVRNEAATNCITVRGRVKCNEEIDAKANPIFLKLVDYDGINSDDEIDNGYNSANSGSFQLGGCASDPVGAIDPELHLFHKCSGKEARIRLVLPDSVLKAPYNYADVIYISKLTSDSEKKKIGYKDEANKKYPVPKCGSKSSSG